MRLNKGQGCLVLTESHPCVRDARGPRVTGHGDCRDWVVPFITDGGRPRSEDTLLAFQVEDSSGVREERVGGQGFPVRLSHPHAASLFTHVGCTLVWAQSELHSFSNLNINAELSGVKILYLDHSHLQFPLCS